MRWWLIVAAWLFVDHRAPADPPKPVRVLADVHAWAFETIAGKVAVIDDAFTTVTAFDVATGARAWHVTLEAKAQGRHTLHALDARLAAWTGETLHLLDPATGRDLAVPDAPMNGTQRREGGCWLDYRSGACAWSCECSFQLFDCASGARIGRRFDSTYVEMFPPNEPPSAGCYSGSGTAIGRAGGLAIVSAEDVETAPASAPHGLGGTPPITAAIELATGKEAWRLPIADGGLATTGISPDAATCWLTGRDEGLNVVDCKTGKRLWRTPGDGDATAQHVIAFVPAHGLFELSGTSAALYDERTGKRRWRSTLPAGTIAWPRGLVPALGWQEGRARAIALLDPSSGAIAATIDHPKDAPVVVTATNVFIARDAELRSYDLAGKLVASAPITSTATLVGADRVLAITRDAALVLALPDLHEVGRVPGTFTDQRFEGALGPHRALLFDYDAKKPGRLLLVATD